MNKMKTHQETFNIVSECLLKQGDFSTDEKGACYYRHPDGSKCAAGWLIPDALYDAEMENCACYVPEDERKYWSENELKIRDVISEILKNKGYDPEFVFELQKIHDHPYEARFDGWKLAMIEFAENNNLNADVFKC